MANWANIWVFHKHRSLKWGFSLVHLDLGLNIFTTTLKKSQNFQIARISFPSPRIRVRSGWEFEDFDHFRARNLKMKLILNSDDKMQHIGNVAQVFRASPNSSLPASRNSELDKEHFILRLHVTFVNTSWEKNGKSYLVSFLDNNMLWCIDLAGELSKCN